MTELTQEFRQALIAAGWYDGRKVDVSRFITPGFDNAIHDGCRKFLEEFGGLTLEWSKPGPLRPINSSINLDHLIDPNVPLPKFTVPLQEREGKLIPIFTSDSYPMIVFAMAPSGRVYAFLDDDDFEDFIWGPWIDGVSAMQAYLTDNIRRNPWPVAQGEGSGPILKALDTLNDTDAKFDEGPSDLLH